MLTQHFTDALYTVTFVNTTFERERVCLLNYICIQLVKSMMGIAIYNI